VIHVASLAAILNGPAELDNASQIPGRVAELLDTPRWQQNVFYRCTGGHYNH
jgi:hypothetical protein